MWKRRKVDGEYFFVLQLDSPSSEKCESGPVSRNIGLDMAE